MTIAIIKAHVISVGGSYAEIRIPRAAEGPKGIPSEAMLELPLEREQMRALGHYLYQDVELVIRTATPAGAQGDEDTATRTLFDAFYVRTHTPLERDRLWKALDEKGRDDWRNVARNAIAAGADPRRLP